MPIFYFMPALGGGGPRGGREDKGGQGGQDQHLVLTARSRRKAEKGKGQ